MAISGQMIGGDQYPVVTREPLSAVIAGEEQSVSALLAVITVVYDSCVFQVKVSAASNAGCAAIFVKALAQNVPTFQTIRV